MIMQRPSFRNTDDYLRHVQNCLDQGRTPWAPATRGELIAVVDAHPEIGRRFLPGADDLRALNLPGNFGREPKPFPEEWQEQFLATLSVDADFAKAVAVLIGGAA